MAKNKFYGVRVGRKIDVFTDWASCSKSVTGYKGADYMGFSNYDDAYEYVYGAKPSVIEASKSTFNSDEVDFESATDVVTIYTASKVLRDKQDEVTGVGFGYVAEVGNLTIKNLSKLNCKTCDEVSAELTAVIKSLEYCIANDILNIEICYINDAVERYALGEWSGHNPVTQRYVEVMCKMQSIMQIGFRCVRNSNNELSAVARILAEKGANY